MSDLGSNRASFRSNSAAAARNFVSSTPLTAFSNQTPRLTPNSSPANPPPRSLPRQTNGATSAPYDQSTKDAQSFTARSPVAPNSRIRPVPPSSLVNINTSPLSHPTSNPATSVDSSLSPLSSSPDPPPSRASRHRATNSKSLSYSYEKEEASDNSEIDDLSNGNNGNNNNRLQRVGPLDERNNRKYHKSLKHHPRYSLPTFEKLTSIVYWRTFTFNQCIILFFLLVLTLCLLYYLAVQPILHYSFITAKDSPLNPLPVSPIELPIIDQCEGDSCGKILKSSPFVAPPDPQRTIGFESVVARRVAPTAADITIYTVFDPELEHNYWLRAMYTWSLRIPYPEHIFVFVREYEDCKALSVLPASVTCRVSSCWDERLNSPYLKCVIEDANKRAETELMVFVEDHLLLFQDFVPALVKVGSKLDQFLMVGSSTSLTLHVDSNLALDAWQHDIEAAFLYDSSAESQRELEHKLHANVDHSHSLHYFAYVRTELDLSNLSPKVLMGGGQFYGHQWERLLVSSVLLRNIISVIDVSGAVTAVELSHKDNGNKTKDVNEYNYALTANFSGISTMNLGRLENAHYLLTGRCPTCSLKENREADLPLILIRHANQFKQIIVIAVNADYLALAFNWICRAHSIGVFNYVMLAEDRVSYRILRKMNVPVVLRKDAPYKKQAALPGSKEFQETLYLRAIFFHQVISLGFSMILSHLDTIWFESPLSLFAESECDMFVQMEGGDKAGGGILTVRANRLGLQFVNDYLNCEFENWQFIVLHGRSRFSYSDDPDIDCVELISTRLTRRNSLRRCPLDPMRYVSENVFFDKQTPQEKAIFPAFVHLNKANGVPNKTAVFLNWDLWMVDDAKMSIIPSISLAHSHGAIECKSPPTPIKPPLFEDIENCKIIINVLASTEFFGLSETLNHLAAAVYDDTTIVDLRITVQQPEHDTSTNSRNHVKTTQVANDFVWPHGDKLVLYLERYVGPTSAWLDYWELGEPGQEEYIFQLALQAGQSVSQQFFIWLMKALSEYYFDPFNYDPYLMGIQLQHQLTIIGESPYTRYGSRLPSTITNATVYEYQYVPLFGTLFFPRHFLSFLRWYSNQNHTALTSACVPTIISNIWYKSDPVKFWWQWLVRFTFEAGWYVLYTNFHSSQAEKKPRALLVDETPIAGQLSVSLIKKLATRELVFIPADQIKLYDFHFNEFTLTRAMLQRRKQLFPPQPSMGRVKSNEEEIAEKKQKEQSAYSKETGGSGKEEEEVGLWEKLKARRFAITSLTDPLAHSAATTTTADPSLTLLVGDDSSDDLIGDVHPDEVSASSSDQLAASAKSEEDAKGITATDLMIETMMIAMNENDESDESGTRFDEQYPEQISKIKAKLKIAKTGSIHHHTNVRGSRHDRCFIIADYINDADIPEIVEVLPPLNLTLTMAELYTQTYQNVISKLPKKAGEPIKDPEARFIVYQPSKLAVPFDRHLRGIYFCFIVALVTNRVMLIDLPEFESQFDSPFPSMKWSYSQFSKYFTPSAAVETAIVDEKKIKESLRTESLMNIYPQTVLYHIDQVSHDRLLFINKLYRMYAPALFDTYSRMRRTGSIMKLLMGKPKNALIAASKDTMKSLGLTAVKYTVCVHVVVPPHAQNRLITEEDPLPGVIDEHWQCIKSNLIHLGFVRDDTAIFFSSNKPSIWALNLAEKHMNKYGKVVINPSSWDANVTSYGICNSTVRASFAHEELTNNLIYDPYLINSYIFGECDVSISSGTTYGIFNAARTGYSKRAYLYKAAPLPIKKNGKWIVSDEKEYCGPMHRIDLPRDNDINF